jgi:hypothetical protein
MRRGALKRMKTGFLQSLSILFCSIPISMAIPTPTVRCLRLFSKHITHRLSA